MAGRLVVKVTVGAEAPERCNQAFTVAAAAVATGAEVELWLTGESAWFALPGRANLHLDHAAPVQDLLDLLLREAAVVLCTQCAARRGIAPGDVTAGVRIAGAAAFVEAVLQEGTQALVY